MRVLAGSGGVRSTALTAFGAAWRTLGRLGQPGTDSQVSWSAWWLMLGKPGYQIPAADPVDACRPANTEAVGPCAVKRNPAIGPSLAELLN